MQIINDATITTEWNDDNGTIITAKCKINTQTKEVFDIERKTSNLSELTKQYVTIQDNQYPVYYKADRPTKNDYYFK